MALTSKGPPIFLSGPDLMSPAVDAACHNARQPTRRTPPDTQAFMTTLLYTKRRALPKRPATKHALNSCRTRRVAVERCQIGTTTRAGGRQCEPTAGDKSL